MKNKLLKLIEALKDRKSEADTMEDRSKKCGHYGIAVCYSQRSTAYDFCIQQLTKILNEGSVAASDMVKYSDGVWRKGGNGF